MSSDNISTEKDLINFVQFSVDNPEVTVSNDEGKDYVVQKLQKNQKQENNASVVGLKDSTSK